MKVKLLNNFSKIANLSLRSLFLRSSSKSDEVTQLINGAGYRGDAYKVKTEDGYVLTLHRVRSNKRKDFKGTAFLMHGLFRNSADFLATGPSIALPYLLADNGFDIFIGNSRGSKYCQEHEKFAKRSSEFWNFSWHEIGYFDLPAMIEFALNKSERSKLFYTGHSQGCTTILALLSSRPSFNLLIAQMHLMAPSVFMHNSTSPAFKLGSRTILKKLTNRMDKFDISPLLKLANAISSFRDQNPESLMKMYREITCRVIGRNKGDVQLSLEAIKAFNYFMSPTVSIKQLSHYIQLYKSGKFQKFDYEDLNNFHYGSSKPPEYNLNDVRVSTYLYHAEEDLLVVKEGVDELFKALPNVINYDIIPDFNHLDVMLGRDSRKLLYNKILDRMTAKKI